MVDALGELPSVAQHYGDLGRIRGDGIVTHCGDPVLERNKHRIAGNLGQHVGGARTAAHQRHRRPVIQAHMRLELIARVASVSQRHRGR